MKTQHPDYYLIIIFFALIFFGLIILASSSYFLGCREKNDCFFYLKHQLLRGLLPGIFSFLLFYLLNYKFLKKASLVCLILTILLLIIVFIPGLKYNQTSASRWVKIGIVLQPSEIAKLTFIIYLSAWLAKHKEKINTQKEIFVTIILFILLISGLLFLQPDLGTLIVFATVSVAIYFLAKAPLRHIGFLFLLLACSVLVVAWTDPHRLQRIITFLNPGQDLSGAGYHINQAIAAIVSGGFWGQGLGYSLKKIYSLPQVLSDSIFAVMAEELGFLSTAVIIALYFYLTYRIFRLSLRVDDTFAKLLSAGIGFWFIFQTIINISTMLGLVPLTGIPLPLIGYGGTNFVVFCAAFGILANISKSVKLD